MTTGAISRAKLQSDHYHQQTNTQPFPQAGCPSCRPTNSVKALKGNITFDGLAYPKLTWGLPTLSLITNSSWLHSGRVAMPLISPLIPVPQVWMLLLKTSEIISVRTVFTRAPRSIALYICYGNLAGWLSGCLSVTPVMEQPSQETLHTFTLPLQP